MSWPPPTQNGQRSGSTTNGTKSPAGDGNKPSSTTSTGRSNKDNTTSIDTVALHIQLPFGRTVKLEFPSDTRIHEVKERLHEEFTHVSPASQQIVRQGAPLVDQLSLQDCSIKSGETLWLLRKAPYRSRVTAGRARAKADQDEANNEIKFLVVNMSTREKEEMSMSGNATIKDLKERLLELEFTRIPIQAQEIVRRRPLAVLRDGQTLLECRIEDCILELSVKDFDGDGKRGFSKRSLSGTPKLDIEKCVCM